MTRRVLILGSTGSIGCSALDVAAAHGEEIRVVGLAAGSRWRELAEQCRRYQVGSVALADERHADALRAEVPAGTRLFTGAEGLVRFVQETDADFALAAIVGAAGLPATLAAVERGMDVGLANKESLVVAGSLLIPLARQRGVNIIPVDSEHSAVFQALKSGRPEEVKRIYLTASGGPFRTWQRERIDDACLEDALRHPTWSMGPKITIDSASMMNKALEVIEATHLFDIPAEQVEVLVHPESIVHSMVEFCDGSVMAQLGTPDMRTPIQYAVTYPRRVAATAPTLNWREIRALHFEPPDFERFPSLRLGFETARRRGSYGAVFNAANEAAVERFRRGEIRFGGIPRLTERALERHDGSPSPSLDELLAADDWARREVFAWK